jgi:hypothetical protein
MVKHIVVWKLRDSLDGKGKSQLIQEMKARLETLPLLVPGLLQLEVGTHQGAPSEMAGDLVLVTAFKDWEGLKAYDGHPEHEKVKPFVKERTIERRVVDYEV